MFILSININKITKLLLNKLIKMTFSPTKNNKNIIVRSKSAFTINQNLRSPSNHKDKYATNTNPSKIYKSPEKQATINPSKKTVNLNKISIVDEEVILKKFQKNRENLSSYFQFHEILYTNGLPLKCITHNNILSLYCQNERKLLCVNCVYNTTQHKLHRVNPIKNCMKTIQADNARLRKIFEKQIESFQSIVKANIEYSSKLKQIFTTALDDIVIEFDKITLLLHQKFDSLKNSLLENFQETLHMNQLITTEVTYLKNIYQEKNNILFNNNKKDEPKSVFQHSILTTLIDSENFDPKIIKNLNKQEVKSSLIGQIYKIREYINNLKLFKTNNNVNKFIA